MNASAKSMQRQIIQCLRENQLARVHRLIAPNRENGLKHMHLAYGDSSRRPPKRHVFVLKTIGYIDC
jgi:hypothetical protein